MFSSFSWLQSSLLTAWWYSYHLQVIQMCIYYNSLFFCLSLPCGSPRSSCKPMLRLQSMCASLWAVTSQKDQLWSKPFTLFWNSVQAHNKGFCKKKYYQFSFCQSKVSSIGPPRSMILYSLQLFHFENARLCCVVMEVRNFANLGCSCWKVLC